MLARLIAGIVLTVCFTKIAVASDYQFGQTSNGVCEMKKSAVTGGTLTDENCYTNINLYDKDTGDIFECGGKVSFMWLNGTFSKEPRPRVGACSKIFSLPTPHPVVSFKDLAVRPLVIDSGYTSTPQTMNYWVTDKAGSTEVCMFIQFNIAPSYPSTVDGRPICIPMIMK